MSAIEDIRLPALHDISAAAKSLCASHAVRQRLRQHPFVIRVCTPIRVIAQEHNRWPPHCHQRSANECQGDTTAYMDMARMAQRGRDSTQVRTATAANCRTTLARCNTSTMQGCRRHEDHDECHIPRIVSTMPDEMRAVRSAVHCGCESHHAIFAQRQ